ncbi:MAG: hypothetical protein OZSIB_2117 [Candidatus Ozemobacter sibiricus]|jgi:hypothetical protein|uniref:Uncharacterized protein n=1 Tax=Candidatus Ozemobacter sibiricus TaxID=2268124 RepID=A0A367ZSY8_9BACT|nr:MAG: hypothetical protein OZSIB_2117 [Candidatus Ozemobacter sibiricus]
MTIKPIDVKATVLVNNEASRLREGAKAQEAGQSQYAAQNQAADLQKVETVRDTQATEHKNIRKEDEEHEKGKSPPEPKPRQPKKEGETEEEPAPPVKDGVRGRLIDVKV